MTLTNPFPIPNLTSEKNQQSLQWIEQRIKSPEGLKFFDCLQKIQESINNKDLEQATINCYYTSNLIINSKNFDNDNHKLELINGFVDSLTDLKKELEKI